VWRLVLRGLILGENQEQGMQVTNKDRGFSSLSLQGDILLVNYPLFTAITDYGKGAEHRELTTLGAEINYSCNGFETIITTL